jgi:hypothetical protein
MFILYLCNNSESDLRSCDTQVKNRSDAFRNSILNIHASYLIIIQINF